PLTTSACMLTETGSVSHACRRMAKLHDKRCIPGIPGGSHVIWTPSVDHAIALADVPKGPHRLNGHGDTNGEHKDGASPEMETYENRHQHPDQSRQGVGQERRPPRPAASPIDFRIDEKLEKHGSRQQDRERTRFSVANHPAGTREKKNQKRRKDEESSGRREEQPGDARGNGVLELADFD